MLKFDAESHTYYWNGKPVPSVTSILNDFMQVEIGGTRYHVNRFDGAVIPSEVMAGAAQKGSDIHAGCQCILEHGLDWSALDGMYEPPLREFEQWLSNFKPEVLYTEAPFYSRRHRYAGTIDIIAKIDKALCFIDIKTGASSSVGPQLAAYEMGWCEENSYTGKTQRWALWLFKDGSPYRFRKLANVQDYAYFKACLAIHNYHQGGRK